MTKKSIILCRCCRKESPRYLWTGVLISLEVKYFECQFCGYVETEEPYWLDEAYSNVINFSDTGIMKRNSINAQKVLCTLSILGLLKGRVVDYAGGYGLLVRILRDYGIDALWSDSHCTNLVSRGFEYNNESAGLITVFEAFEHFVDPGAELDRMLKIAPNILLSTEVISDPAPDQKDWWYYGKEHGQHIGFFRAKTLKKLAESRGMYFTTDDRSFHLITTKPVNALLWKFVMLFSKLVSPSISLSLSSKTWSDHDYQSRRL